MYGIRSWRWVVRIQKVEIYRRKALILPLQGTLLREDVLTSPLLPGFSCIVKSFICLVVRWVKVLGVGLSLHAGGRLCLMMD